MPGQNGNQCSCLYFSDSRATQHIFFLYILDFIIATVSNFIFTISTIEHDFYLLRLSLCRFINLQNSTSIVVLLLEKHFPKFQFVHLTINLSDSKILTGV